MLKISARWTGRKRLERDMRRAVVKLPRRLRQNVGKAAELVTGQAQRNIRGSRTRSFYKVKGGTMVRRKEPRAITAGPHQLGIFSGHLRQSITNDVWARGRRVNAEIGTGARYAEKHEEGKNGMPKRPFLAPAIDKTKERVFKLIGLTFKVIR